jgi:hypothetical protein
VALVLTSSTVSIENCLELKFGLATDAMLGEAKKPLHHGLNALPKPVAQAELKVQDFNHVHANLPSPNWRRMSESECQRVYDQAESESH